MLDPKVILLAALTLESGGFAAWWLGRLRASRSGVVWPTAASVVVGALTNFFDTLGVGSFAPTTWLFRTFALVPDRLVPGTLNVGHALPSVVQALVFIAIVEVDTWTLWLMIGASMVGAWIGAGVVAGWGRRRVQTGMGLALLLACGLLVRQFVAGAPAGAEAIGLGGVWLALGVAGNFVLGATMMIGVGLYAPCMILVSLLGLNAKAAFPIMMGSCAFLMPVAAVRFVDREAYAPRVAVGIALGGVPAVLVAAFVVRALPLDAVRVLVLAVALYTSLSMLAASRAANGDS